jgi:hypothetical protein
MRIFRFIGSLAVLAGLFLTTGAWAQDRDRMRDSDHWDSQNKRYTQLVPGTLIGVRPKEGIDVERKDDRVFTGIVDQDVRGTNGQLAIPLGSTVELIVRVAPDNDLILDLESVTVNSQRYAIKTDPNRVQSERDSSLVGAIVGAINGGQARGRAIRIPRETLLTFRIERPLEMGVADRGLTRDGRHYHDPDKDKQ